ncbi:MAG: hypothetical protein AB7E77_03730 [Desulfobulbus sp.]
MDTVFTQFSGGIDRFGLVTEQALGTARSVREAIPIFYPGWHIAEISVTGPNDVLATLSFLVNDQSVIPILGASTPIHKLNEKGALSLTNEGSVASYLRFFCNAVRADEGPFRIIENVAQIPLLEACSEINDREIARLIPQIEITKQEGDAWTTKALINYCNGLFLAHFKIQASGMIEMVGDELVMDLKNVKRERIVSGLRFFDGVFEDESS